MCLTKRQPQPLGLETSTLPLSHCQGRTQDSMLGGGGAKYLKSKVFSRERRRREAMLGGSGDMLPREIFDKNGAIRCILVHSMAHFSLHLFAVFEVIFFKKNVAFDMLISLKTKEKNLKCGFKSGTDLIQQAILS